MNYSTIIFGSLITAVHTFPTMIGLFFVFDWLRWFLDSSNNK